MLYHICSIIYDHVMIYLHVSRNQQKQQTTTRTFICIHTFIDTRKKQQIIRLISEWLPGVTIGVTVEPGSQLRYYLINTELKVGWLNLYAMRS